MYFVALNMMGPTFALNACHQDEEAFLDLVVNAQRRFRLFIDFSFYIQYVLNLH
jgi:hypothetical protein